MIRYDTSVIMFRRYKSTTRRMTVYDDDNESESNAACARQEEASDVEGESDQDSGDGRR